MLTRIISGAVALAAFIGIVISPPIVFKAAMAILAAGAVYELFKTLGFTKYKAVFAVAALGGLLFPFLNNIPYEHTLMIYLFVFAATGVFSVLFDHENFSTADFAACASYTLIIISAFTAPAVLRDSENGGYYIWLPFIAAWSTDTLAYFSGMLLGKHKLCEKLSPKKTVEGALGGVLGAVIGILVYSAFSPGKVNIIYAVIYAVIASVLSQAGDIFASAIKREHGIKDFGKIMPGHGGILDRFDSLLLTAPFTLIFINITHFI